MNILHVESSRSWGGQEYRTCLEINWLNRHGHRAWLMCDPASEVFARAQELQTELRPINLRRRLDLSVSLAIGRFCRREQIDLITAYSSKDHWLCFPVFLAGTPLLRARCVTSPTENAGRAFIFRYGCTRILADAQVVKTELEQLGVPGDKISVVGSAVDLTRFRPDLDGTRFRAEMGLSAETPLILNIGMIRSDKGQMRLMRAAFRILEARSDARFIFVGKGTGEGAREERMRQAIADAGLSDKILMLGYRWDTPEIIAAADMLVIASLGTEASPIVLREAFACGRPVIATDIGDVAEIVQHEENGLLVPPNDIDALVAAVQRFLQDHALAARCGANAAAFARKHFDFNRMMAAKLEVSRATARGQGGSAGRGPIDRVDQLPESTKIPPIRR